MALSKYSSIFNMTVDGNEVTFHKLEKGHLIHVYEIIKELGWSKSLQDILDYFENQPTAFYGAFLKSNPTQVISCCSVTMWEGIGYLTMFFTEKKYRQKGIGKQLLLWVCELQAAENIILTDVKHLASMYYELGFKHILFKRVAFHGKVHKGTSSSPLGDGASDVLIHQLTDHTLEMLIDFDRAIFKIERSRFLKLWLHSQVSTVRIAVKNTKCVGYIVVRHNKDAALVKLAPLVAETPHIAHRLLNTVKVECAELCSKPFLIHTPQSGEMKKVINMYETIFDDFKEVDYGHTRALKPVSRCYNWAMIYYFHY